MIWPPRRISILLSQGLVHPSYRLSVFCPMHPAGKGGFEPDGGKEKVYRESIQAVQARSAVAKSWRARRASWLQPWVRAGLARCFEVVAQTRVVLWLSSPSATELGFCLHHVYGLPYLPPTALKGLASKALWRYNNPSATWQNPPPDVLDLFGEGGDRGHEGRVAFLDGIPLGDQHDRIILDVDVMTPHHAGYYAGSESLHDCEGPNPLPFLCIPPGQRFEIGLVYTREPKTGARGPDHWLSEAEKWLLQGLSGMGIGAKTTSGYGIMVRPGGVPASSQASGPQTTQAEDSSPSTGRPPASAAPDSVVATIVSTDRKRAVGTARTDDGQTITFKCAWLSKLGLYPQAWATTHGQRYVFTRQGDEFIPTRKEESS